MARKLRSSLGFSTGSALMVASARLPELTWKPTSPGTPMNRSVMVRKRVTRSASFMSPSAMEKVPLPLTSTSTFCLVNSKVAVNLTKPNASRVRVPPTLKMAPVKSMVISSPAGPTTTASGTNGWPSTESASTLTEVTQLRAARPGMVADDAWLVSMLSAEASITSPSGSPASPAPAMFAFSARKLRSSAGAVTGSGLMVASTRVPELTWKPMLSGTPTNRSLICRNRVTMVALSRSPPATEKVPSPSTSTSTCWLSNSNSASALTNPKALSTSSPPMRVSWPAKSMVIPPIMTGSASKVASSDSKSMAVVQSNGVGAVGVPDAELRTTSSFVASMTKSGGRPARLAPPMLVFMAKKLRSSVAGSAALTVASSSRPLSTWKPTPPGTPAKKSVIARSMVSRLALSRSMVPLPSTSTSTVCLISSKVAVAVTAPKASRVSAPPMRVKAPLKSKV